LRRIREVSGVGLVFFFITRLDYRPTADMRARAPTYAFIHPWGFSPVAASLSRGRRFAPWSFTEVWELIRVVIITLFFRAKKLTARI
jgi:hypothetical protein